MNHPAPHFTARVERPLPAFGVLALVVDGIDFAVIAKSLDAPCSVVKGYAEAAIRDLANRVGLQIPVAKRPYHTMGSYVIETLRNHDIEWTAALSATEQLSVIETRAYFRAFENSPFSVEKHNG